MECDKFSISLQIKAKHGLIYNYMVKNNLTQRALAKKIGVSAIQMGKILNFKWLPKPHYQSVLLAEKLCLFFNCKLEDIYPKQLVDKLKHNPRVADLLCNKHLISEEIDLIYLESYQGVEPLSLETPEKIFLEKDFVAQIKKSLSFLKPREQEILKLRYGLEEKGIQSLGKIACKFGISRERVRQVEAKAIRKMKHPSRSDNLEVYAQ